MPNHLNPFNRVGLICLISANLALVGPLNAEPAKVKLIKHKKGRWELLVNGNPYLIKGIAYEMDEVGKKPKSNNLWMLSDKNNNGSPDGPYDSWVDENKNNIKDNNEYAVGDFQLLKEMGCNTIRIYHWQNLDKEVLRDLYNRFGISVIMGNFLGAYTVGSGANWERGTDYTDKKQLKNMMDDVTAMVMQHKDEPYVLTWMLGNENDTVGHEGNSTLNNTNAAAHPKEYAKFLNKTAKMIQKLDPNHPVGTCIATLKLSSALKKYAPHIDYIGMNSYSGPYGFNVLWNQVKQSVKKPLLITEYGTDCYNQNKEVEDEKYQALYLLRSWKDIQNNSFTGTGTGNALGGIVYTRTDRWWLNGSPEYHDTTAGGWQGPTVDGWFNDEWFGIVSQGDGAQSPFSRQLRMAYYAYKQVWNNGLDVSMVIQNIERSGGSAIGKASSTSGLSSLGMNNIQELK